MTVQTRSYAFHGMSVRDKLLLKSMIARAALRAERRWVADSVESADCVFVQGELPGVMRANAQPVHLPIDGSTPLKGALQCASSVSAIWTLLNDIDRRMGSNHWHPLIEKIQHKLSGTDEFVLLDSSQSGWIFYPAQRQYAALGLVEHAPRELLETESGQWRLESKAHESRHPRRALEVLMWYLGLASGGEGVLPSIGVHRPLRMRSWPYLLARAPREFSQLATLLREAPRSAIELQATSGTSMASVAAFVNACALCGFLVPVVEQIKAAPAAPFAAQSAGRSPQRFTRFLGAIRVALGMT